MWSCVSETYEYPPAADIPVLDTDAYVQFDTEFGSPSATFVQCGDGGPRFDNRFSPYKGGTDRPVLVVEHFSALQCPHCAHFATYVDDMLASRPAIRARVRFYFHHFAFTDYTDYHMAAFAASQQGMDKFWQLHDILYANIGTSFTYQDLRDVAQFDLALNMNQYDDTTRYSTTEGQRAYDFLMYEKITAQVHGVTGTPTVYLCGEPVADWRELEGKILQNLRKEN